MNKHNLKVGQTLYIKREWSGRSDERPLEEYSIEKIGRVYAKLSHPYYRVNLETLELDGSRGSVWLSEKHYKDALELNEAWRKFTSDIGTVRYHRPSCITLEAIKEARLKLGI